jgi:hypothetical protein
VRTVAPSRINGWPSSAMVALKKMYGGRVSETSDLMKQWIIGEETSCCRTGFGRSSLRTALLV